MNTFIKGNYKRSLFEGDNGYIVGLFKVKETSSNLSELINKTITFTGYFHELNDSDTYVFFGDYIFHPKYNEQFAVSSYERCKPEEKDAIVEFLSSDLFVGIGKRKAQKIVDVLGKDTFDMIINNPSNLLLIPTIKQKDIDILHNTLVEYESSYTTIVTLTDMGFTIKESMSIYNKYKVNTNSVLEENLYKLLLDIKDISFKKIDSIALKSNYPRDDSRRIRATILYVMEELCNIIGHCFLFIDDIYTNTKKVLLYDLEKSSFIDNLNYLIINLMVVKDIDKYYLKDLYDAEENIVKRIKYLSKKSITSIKKLDKYINNIELNMGISFNKEQLDAIYSSLLKNFLIITGGPGTGKTTIVKAIVDTFKEVNKLSYSELVNSIALLAPTGRASKRLAEKTLLPATTIHRFLKWNKETNKFQINERNKSDVKFVILDESSMIDISLFNNLLKGLTLDTKIIMIGDYNQLPSVGPGQLLKDLIESSVLDVIELKQLYRQSIESNIIQLAYDINSGLINDSIFNVKDDLTFIESSSKELVSNLKNICTIYKDENYKNLQVLVPMYKSLNGIDNLNRILQDIFNPKSSKKKEMIYGEVIYREDDKILQLTNMPDENIFNGDIGIIHSIDNKEITIDFDGNLVRFTPSNFHKFKHGYAISIHKSQGSEFKTVIIPVVKEYSRMLYRKLYYTAVTRSKNKLILLGDILSLKNASLRDNTDIRNTTIKEKIINKMTQV